MLKQKFHITVKYSTRVVVSQLMGNTHQFDLFPQIFAVLEIQDSGRDRLLMRDTYQVLSNREIPDMIKWQMSTVR